MSQDSPARSSKHRAVSGLVFCLGLAALGGCAATSPAAKPRVEPARASEAASARASNADACATDLGSPDRRLTRFELANAVEDVFGIDASALRDLPAPTSSIGDVPDILVGRLLDTSERFLTPYRRAVEKLATEAGARLAAGCDLGKIREGARDEAVRRCVLQGLSLPAARLWRAPLNEAELTTLRAVLEAGKVTDPAAGFRLGVAFLLSSPRFYLLKNETPAGSEDTQAQRRFAAQRLATRLSLVLWSSVPDASLLEHVARSGLADEREFELELGRMLADPRFARFSQEFGRQWLRLDRRPLFRPSLESRSLLEDRERLARAHGDVAHFLERQLAAERPLSELLTSSETELNPLAPAAAERAGLLTSQALLSAISTPIRGGGDENWLGRGLVIESAFLCRTFPLAAVYPSSLWEAHPLLDPHLTAASLRPGEPALLAIRTRDKPCRECHRQLETLGAALSAYDGFGVASGTDAQSPGSADHSSRPPAPPLSSPSELGSWILQSGRFEPCVAQKLLSYVLGRAVLPAQRPADRCLVQRLREARADAPATLRGWLWQSLTSPEFRGQGARVIRDKPTPGPSSNAYTHILTPIAVSAAECLHFDVGAFLVDNCGTAACHGAGAPSASFAVRDSATALRLLRSGKPSLDGYCGDFSSYLDREQPLKSLVVQKLTGGPGSCGAAMPVTGGPRTLAPVEHACFIRWLTEQAPRTP